MRALLLLLTPLLALLLSSCAGNSRQIDFAYLDLGHTAPTWRPAAVPLGDVSVVTPPWLTTSAIHYHLLYAEGQRRQTYSESRWSVPPADLIERALNRQAHAPEGGCRLRLDVDALLHVFDTAQASRTLLEVRASLLAPNRDAVLARKSFAIARPAPTPDARGGAAAAAAAVRALGEELGVWLEQLATADAAAPLKPTAVVLCSSLP